MHTGHIEIMIYILGTLSCANLNDNVNKVFMNSVEVSDTYGQCTDCNI